MLAAPARTADSLLGASIRPYGSRRGPSWHHQTWYRPLLQATHELTAALQERAPTSVAYAETQSMFLDSLASDADWMARYALDRSVESH